MRRALGLLGLLVVVAACSSGQSAGGTGGSGGAATSTKASSSVGTTGGATGATTTTGSSGLGGAGSMDTWASYAKGFFAMYCVECHSASDPTGRDFTQLAVVQKNETTIRCGVAPAQLPGCSGFPPPKQFPISDATGTNPKPTDAERDRIILWIDAGAK